jgi:hypothetical protein
VEKKIVTQVSTVMEDNVVLILWHVLKMLLSEFQQLVCVKKLHAVDIALTDYVKLNQEVNYSNFLKVHSTQAMCIFRGRMEY